MRKLTHRRKDLEPTLTLKEHEPLRVEHRILALDEGGELLGAQVEEAEAEGVLEKDEGKLGRAEPRQALETDRIASVRLPNGRHNIRVQINSPIQTVPSRRKHNIRRYLFKKGAVPRQTRLIGDIINGLFFYVGGEGELHEAVGRDAGY